MRRSDHNMALQYNPNAYSNDRGSGYPGAPQQPIYQATPVNQGVPINQAGQIPYGSPVYPSQVYMTRNDHPHGAQPQVVYQVRQPAQVVYQHQQQPIYINERRGYDRRRDNDCDDCGGWLCAALCCCLLLGNN